MMNHVWASIRILSAPCSSSKTMDRLVGQTHVRRWTMCLGELLDARTMDHVCPSVRPSIRVRDSNHSNCKSPLSLCKDDGPCDRVIVASRLGNLRTTMRAQQSLTREDDPFECLTSDARSTQHAFEAFEYNQFGTNFNMHRTLRTSDVMARCPSLSSRRQLCSKRETTDPLWY